MSSLSNDLASLRIERKAPPPKRKLPAWIFVVLALAAVAVGVKLAAPKVSSQVFKQEVQVTEVALVSPNQASILLSSSGYVLPQTVAKVGPLVIGRIATVNIKEGGKVKKGDVIFEMDATDQKSAVAAAKAKVASANARAAAARARAVAAKTNADELRAQLARNKKLAESGAVPQSTVDDLDLKVKGLDAQVSVANADASAAVADATSAQADVNTLESNVTRMTILAPIDGTAVSKPAAVGDVVQPGVNTLVELADFESLVIETDVPEARLGLVKDGMPCVIVLDAYADRQFKGKVVDFVPKLNRAKATATVKVKIIDATEKIYPEMASRVSFLEKELDDAAQKAKPKKIVPANAVVDRNGGKAVFVINDGKAKLVPIKVIAPFAGGFEIDGDPPHGTKIVKDPPASLSDGQPIKEGNA
jgi:HlyD family secretion protein